MFDQIMEGNFEFVSPYWDGISTLAKELITNMLQKEPDSRYSAREITKHGWVTAESTSDKDLHISVAKEMKSHFNRKPKPSISSAGIRLVATTALDKGSRFFEGRKPQLTLPNSNGHEDPHENEIF